MSTHQLPNHGQILLARLPPACLLEPDGKIAALRAVYKKNDIRILLLVELLLELLMDLKDPCLEPDQVCCCVL